jgi:DNA-nicking Smr family endonuclease
MPLSEAGESDPHADGPWQIPIEDVLDLHSFDPREIKELIPAYLAACREKGILQVRLIHGKGVGHLRRSVHAILSRLPEVLSFSLASAHFGSWGATIVNLHPLDKQPKKSPAPSVG